MPKNNVSDPITDQEMAFAHLILSGTMNDRRAAEAVGMNPDTAAYTKAKPRVRAYMIEHRAAVREKLVDQEAEGLRRLNIGRDQILNRLWELATLSHEATRGTITGQMKAMSMIVAIEGLIPDRRHSPSGTPFAAPSVKADIDPTAWLHEQPHQQHRPPAARVSDLEPTPPPATKPADTTPSPSPINPFVSPEKSSQVPAATSYAFDTVIEQNHSLKLPFSRDRRFSGSRR
jgi:hypothetical protein